MDARKAVIGPLAGFRRGAARSASEDGSPAASQSAIGEKKLVRSVRGWPPVKIRADASAEPPVKMHSVKKFGDGAARDDSPALVTPGAKSEETLVPSQSVIGEIKMASTCERPAPTVRPQSRPKRTPGGRQSMDVQRVYEVSHRGRALASQTVIGEIKL